MSEYGKLFRKKEGQKNTFILKPYHPDKEKYFELINKAREKSYKQVIVNSKIMTDILFRTLNSGGVILKINMSENTDQFVTDNIKVIIRKLRENNLLFVKLKEQLDWASESGSIDINSIEIYSNKKRYEIYSNGIISGENIIDLFQNNIQIVLEYYFNG
ncbi:hypothetical protein ABER02_11245 [Rossellomorea marisflavi]|uniref:hypothetical protein n=1 Tax=Rossellomorea marisflavi TaxID=189381 RepID=UPI003D2C943D